MTRQTRRTIAGREYDISPLSAMKQFHVVRKLAGVASAIGESLGTVLREGGLEKMRTMAMSDPANSIRVIEPIMKAVAAMSEEDAEYVIYTCLGVVQRREGESWARVTDGSRGIMFEDMSMPVMLQIVWAVLEANVQGFFDELRIASSGAESKSA
jgi:hypothetical protein